MICQRCGCGYTSINWRRVPCPTSGQPNVGTFPAEVMAPVQYGQNVQALAVYLHQGQLVPMAHTCDLLEEMCGCHLSQGTLLRWVQEASERLQATVEKIADPLERGTTTARR